MTKTIEYLNNTTGSGKTEYITNIISVNTDQKYLLVVPNRELCGEIEKRLVSKGVTQIRTINQITAGHPVKELKSEVCSKTTRVIITTQASFKTALIEGLKFKKEWNLILDEDFAPVIEHEIYFTKATIASLMACFEFTPSEYKDGYIDVCPNHEYLDEVFIKKNVQDTLLNNKPFRTLVSLSYSKSYNTMVDSSHYNRLKDFVEADKDKNGFKFYAISLLNMDDFFTFKSVTVSSSCYEHSLSYKLFKLNGVKLAQIELPDEVVVDDYSHVTIKYYTDKNWSTQLRTTKVNDKHTMESLVYSRCINDINGREFIYNANTTFRDKVDGGKLVTSIQGVNKYIKYRTMLYMPSLNASGDFVRFFSMMGITRKDIDFDRNVLSAFQFVSRGAIRDVSNKQSIDIYVMDRRTAVFLEQMFPKSKVEYVCIGKQKNKVPDKVKSFVCRIKKRIKEKQPIRDTTMNKYIMYMIDYYGKSPDIKKGITND